MQQNSKLNVAVDIYLVEKKNLDKILQYPTQKLIHINAVKLNYL